MKAWTAVLLILLLIAFAGGYWFARLPSSSPTISPLGKIHQKPLEKYAIESLSKRTSEGSRIIFDTPVATTSSFTSYTFHFVSDDGLVTGLVHLPVSRQAFPNTKQEKFPVIVAFRGYVDRETYTPGEGTRRMSEVLASRGFLTLAPDFFGYGGSDRPSTNIFEERFQTYTTALTLLASIKSLPMADPSRVGLWGHSNGGQVAITILEVTQKPYPTTLWAPVSKPFPYSILYYTDELSDKGKLLRRELAKFEEEYDVELYSLPNYLDRIAAPLQIHQGTADESVPQKWSEELVRMLRDKEKDVDYFVYPGADHNMLGAWSTVVARDVEFFQQNLK